MRPGAEGQGDTFFCDNAAAFDALSPAEQAEAASRKIIHAAGSLGRSEQNVRKHPGVGAPPSGNGIAERIDFLEPQHQPVVRTHPVTRRRALYLGTSGQSDWLEGPVVGMEPGPDGAGGAWMGEHIHRATDPSRVYRHAWQAGDAVLYDNRVSALPLRLLSKPQRSCTGADARGELVRPEGTAAGDVEADRHHARWPWAGVRRRGGGAFVAEG